MARHKPLIGIPADRRILGPHPFHCVGEKYIAAVAEAADAMPVLMPVARRARPRRPGSSTLDGILLTGSPSNVEPHRYGGPASDPDTLHDPHRDATTLPLIPRAIEAGLPLFARLPRLPGNERRLRRHALAEGAGGAGHARPPRGQGAAARGAVRARARGRAGAAAACCTGSPARDRVMVNSLHAQGVQTLGRGLEVEARAPDGLIEAFRVARARRASRWRCSGTRSGRS